MYIFSFLQGVDTSELVISIENNREKIRIPIYGEAIEPFLHISATKIDFGSILPYSRNKYRIFDIKNPWPIPVEIFFPQYDKYVMKIIRFNCVFAPSMPD